MSFGKTKLTLFSIVTVIAVVVATTACGELEENLEGDEYYDDVGMDVFALSSSRPDMVEEFQLGYLLSLDSTHPIFWPLTGNLSQELYCSRGLYATGYSQRVESRQGSGDDTALNAVRLYCSSPDGHVTETIETLNQGPWGDWDSAYCLSSPERRFLNGATARIEGSQGYGDDTAMNGVKFNCTIAGTAEADNTGPWGNWHNWNYCPAGSAICGIQTNVAPNRGNEDDSALVGMRLFCCSL